MGPCIHHYKTRGSCGMELCPIPNWCATPPRRYYVEQCMHAVMVVHDYHSTPRRREVCHGILMTSSLTGGVLFVVQSSVVSSYTHTIHYSGCGVDELLVGMLSHNHDPRIQVSGCYPTHPNMVPRCYWYARLRTSSIASRSHVLG